MLWVDWREAHRSPAHRKSEKEVGGRKDLNLTRNGHEETGTGIAKPYPSSVRGLHSHSHSHTTYQQSYHQSLPFRPHFLLHSQFTASKTLLSIVRSSPIIPGFSPFVFLSQTYRLCVFRERERESIFKLHKYCCTFTHRLEAALRWDKRILSYHHMYHDYGTNI